MMRQVTRSVSALYLERGLRIASAFVTTVILARHLGLENFGELSYTLSIIAIFVSMASLGLDEILIRDISASQTPRDILRSVAYIRLFASVALFPILILVVIRSSNAPTTGIVLIAALVLLAPLYSFEQLLFAKQRATTIAVLGTVEIIATLLFRIYLVYTDASMNWIMFSYLLEGALRLAILSLYSWKSGLIDSGQTSFTKHRNGILIRQGLPLLAANLAVIGYMKLDQIMLRTMLDAEEVATYAVAVRITESFYFLPMILSTVLLPVLNQAKNTGRYTTLFHRLYQQAFYTGVSITLFLVLFGPLLVEAVFGADYSVSGSYLQIYALGLPLVFLGVSSGKWLIIEGLQQHALYRTLAGLAVNVSLNLILIPRYAGYGAAIATVCSQLMATFLYDFLFRSTRPMAMQKCRILSFSRHK